MSSVPEIYRAVPEYPPKDGFVISVAGQGTIAHGTGYAEAQRLCALANFAVACGYAPPTPEVKELTPGG